MRHREEGAFGGCGRACGAVLPKLFAGPEFNVQRRKRTVSDPALGATDLAEQSRDRVLRARPIVHES